MAPRLLAALAALALLLAACGGSELAAPDAPIRAPGNGIDVGEPPPDGDPSGPELVEPRPGMADVRARAFETATLGDDDRTLTVFFWSGVEPCYVLDRVEVEYGDAEITVTLYEGNDPEAGDAVCIEIALQKAVQVQLDEDVAGRRIVDGAA